MKKRMLVLLAALGLAAAPLSAAAEEQLYQTDVVVIGAGGAGMVAALTAAQTGQQVILVESQPAVGGSTILITSGLQAAKTDAQDTLVFAEADGVEATLALTSALSDNPTAAELSASVQLQWEAYRQAPEGYFDSAELMALDALALGPNMADPTLLLAMCRGSAEAVAWLEALGLPLGNVSLGTDASVKRLHCLQPEYQPDDTMGTALVSLLEEACGRQRNLTLLLNTTADAILTDGGAARGITAIGKTGETVTIQAKAVLLATGGFGANTAMLAEYLPGMEGFKTISALGSQGQGIAMATAAGSATVAMEQMAFYPTVQADTAALIDPSLRTGGGILVNIDGQRFVDETAGDAAVSAAVLAQPDAYAWLIVDQAMTAASPILQEYLNKGIVFPGETIQALGVAIGIDSTALADTLDSWNACAVAHDDPLLGRTTFALPLNSAPYYAIRITPGIQRTLGGVMINANAQVLDPSGQPIPGLYAAGEVTGGVLSAASPEGSALTALIVFGRIAGTSAAAYARSLP